MIGLEALKGEMSIDKICREYLLEKQFVKHCRDRIADNAASLFTPS